MHGTTTTTFRPRQQRWPTTPHIQPVISGRGLSHRRSKWQRATLILDVCAGEVDLELSWRQLAAIAGVSAGTLKAARLVRERPYVVRHNGGGR
jgi:hypothetical protein